MKRVLFITDYFRPEPGGLEGLFVGIARHWPRDAMEVIVTARNRDYLSAPDDRERFDHAEDYGVFRRSPFAKGGFLGTRLNPDFSTLLSQRLESFSPNHVILGQISRSAVMVLKVLARYGLPYSVFLNGGDFKNKLGYLNFRERGIVLGARNVFTLSRYLARGARGFGIPEEKITVIPAGMEPRWKSSGRGKTLPKELRERIGKKTVLVGVGPFVPRKGLDQAVEALHQLPDLHERLHLVLAGSGPEFPYLQELVRIRGLEQHVTMTGFLDDEILGSLMRRADVFVQPGAEREDDIESMGTALMEAAWFGMPTIVGNVGGVEEIVKDGVSGFVVEAGKGKSLAEKIRELTVSERLKTRMGKNAREIAQKEYDMSRTCAAILSRI